MPLCTIGYEKRSLDEYIDLLLANGVEVVLDVRETAWSHKPGFSKTAFAAGLHAAGISYIHLRAAGNPKALRATASSHAECLALYREYVCDHPEILTTLSETLRAHGVTHRRIALTCFERHPEDCHRSILADAWAARNDDEVLHLGPEGCKRLVPA
ncbi:MAG TPA: DUF488 domain-containing protein [Gemmatimonadaceae bacterium]|nr:DUF488 domain-containing protein [Gemmatimonadaceae bacterium]